MTLDQLQGADIGKLLSANGPIVKCVLLRAIATDGSEDDTQKPSALNDNTSNQDSSADKVPLQNVVLTHLIEDIDVDTTPKKSMVSQILGGPITFLGQYEDEGIILMARRPPDVDEGDSSEDLLPLNPHQLQPPLNDCGARGDILIMRVAPTNEILDEAGDTVTEAISPDNDDFFLNYSKAEYVAFASRTDIVAREQDEEEEDEEDGDAGEEVEDEDGDDEEYNPEDDEGEDNVDDKEHQVAMMNLIMGQVLRRFHEENGRGPDTRELLELRSALAEKMGVSVPVIDIQGADWDQKADKKKKRVLEAEGDSKSPFKPILTRKRSFSKDEPPNGDDHAAKRVKFSETQEAESNEATVPTGKDVATQDT